MIYAKKLPFIYSDLFIAIAIIIMVALAIICFVLIPLFVLHKTPTRKVKLIIDKENKLQLSEELSKYFASITIKNQIITFVPLKGVEKVRVSLYFPHLFNPKALTYVLDFKESDVLKVAFPDHHRKVSSLEVIDDSDRLLTGEKPLSLAKSRLWIYSIACGVALAACIFLVVLIYSTHLRRVDNSFIVYYFFALIGGAFVPAIYFGTKLVSKLVGRGK